MPVIAPGVNGASIEKSESALTRAGAVVRRVAADLNAVEAANGEPLEPDATFETMPSVLFDAVAVPDGAEELRLLGQAHEFLRDQYRHCKPILFFGSRSEPLADAGIPTGDDSDWAMVHDVNLFIEALGRHRNWARATDPPSI